MGGGGLGGGNTGPVAQAGPNVMQPGPMPGYVPPAPGMPNTPVAPAPNLGAPAAPMPQLAPGAILPARKQAAAAGDRMIAMGKALQSFSARPGQQQQQPQQPQQQRGTPVNFSTMPAPFIPPPTSTGNGG